MRKKALPTILIALAMSLSITHLHATELILQNPETLLIKSSRGENKEIRKGTISEKITSDNQSFRITFGSNIQEHFVLMLYPDPTLPKNFRFKLKSHWFEVSSDGVLTLTLFPEKNTIEARSGSIGSIKIDGTLLKANHSILLSENKQAPTPQPVPLTLEQILEMERKKAALHLQEPAPSTPPDIETSPPSPAPSTPPPPTPTTPTTPSPSTSPPPHPPLHLEPANPNLPYTSPTLIKLKGEVVTTTHPSHPWQPASLNQPLSQQANVRTGAEAYAYLRFQNQMALLIEPNSEIAIIHATWDSSSKKRHLTIRLKKGTITTHTSPTTDSRNLIQILADERVFQSQSGDFTLTHTISGNTALENFSSSVTIHPPPFPEQPATPQKSNILLPRKQPAEIYPLIDGQIEQMDKKRADLSSILK